MEEKLKGGFFFFFLIWERKRGYFSFFFFSREKMVVIWAPVCFGMCQPFTHDSSTQITFLIYIDRTYVFHLLKTYVMILYNWLILWQNAFYLYLVRLMMCLNTSRNHVSRSSVKASKSVQEIKQRVQIRQLVDSISIPPICRGLRIS